MWELIHWLPSHSALARAQDPEGVGSDWDRHAHLLALIAEVVDVGNAIQVKVNTDPKKPGKEYEPLRIKRPGREVPEEVEIPIPQPHGEDLEEAVRSMGGTVIRGK